ncbi:MAG: hypothetical protein ACLTZM_01540 [Ruminococcus sp.]
MNITNFARKLAEKPVFKTRIKSDRVKLPEIAIGYFLAPFAPCLPMPFSVPI